MNLSPYRVIEDFERGVAEYAGARYCVAVNSCTNALFLALKWAKMHTNSEKVWIPNKTYVGVPMQIIHAGFKVGFINIEWSGQYEIYPLLIWDSARRFTSGMYQAGFVCTSHHWSKILGIQHGGCILHQNEEADRWFRKARFDGRTEGVHPTKDTFDMLGWHCMMPPEVAAQGLVRLSLLPKENADLPNDDYPDLSAMEVFK